MYTGETFRLKKSILGIEDLNGERVAVMIPAGSAIRIVNGPSPDDRRLVDVLWEKRYFAMFAADLQLRGEREKQAMAR